jgi:hypothetical protein
VGVHPEAALGLFGIVTANAVGLEDGLDIPLEIRGGPDSQGEGCKETGQEEAGGFGLGLHGELHVGNLNVV